MAQSDYFRSLRTIAIILFVMAIPFMLLGWWIEPQLETFLESGWLRENRWAAAWLAIGLLVADIVLPVPNSVVCTVIGSIWGPLFGTVIGWFGLTIAAFAGYGLGRLGFSKLVAETETGDPVKNSFAKAPWILAFCRPLPLFAEASVVAAGYYRMRAKQFLIPVAFSNLVLAATWSILGYMAIDNGWLTWGIIVSALIPVIAALAWSSRLAGDRQESNLLF
jgi:uncharacterized membrane protein YdjX (TVP38/TMEM64 family)